MAGKSRNKKTEDFVIFSPSLNVSVTKISKNDGRYNSKCEENIVHSADFLVKNDFFSRKINFFEFLKDAYPLD